MLARVALRLGGQTPVARGGFAHIVHQVVVDWLSGRGCLLIRGVLVLNGRITGDDRGGSGNGDRHDDDSDGDDCAAGAGVREVADSQGCWLAWCWRWRF